MARGELLRKLILSHTRGKNDMFRAVALEIIAEEKRKKNNQLAKDLLRILENSDSSNSFPKALNNISTLPKDREKQTLLVDIRHPDRLFSEIILKPETREMVVEILEENRKSALLKTHGLNPKKKLLFCGPPGCGKTLCAEIISCELGLPILYTRFDAIVSSYLGETASNLRKVFDHASSGNWVVLFDEFDAIGKARDDINEHGEIKRVINSFLQLLDSFTSSSLIIAATNHEKLLDIALWRRFDEIVYFPLPTVNDIRSLLSMKLKNFPHKGLEIKNRASLLKGMSHADIERICFDAIKRCILNEEEILDQSIFQSSLDMHRRRLKIIQMAQNKKK